MIAINRAGEVGVVVFSAAGFHDGTYVQWMQIPTQISPKAKTAEVERLKEEQAVWRKCDKVFDSIPDATSDPCYIIVERLWKQREEARKERDALREQLARANDEIHAQKANGENNAMQYRAHWKAAEEQLATARTALENIKLLPKRIKAGGGAAHGPGLHEEVRLLHMAAELLESAIEDTLAQIAPVATEQPRTETCVRCNRQTSDWVDTPATNGCCCRDCEDQIRGADQNDQVWGGAEL